MYGGGLQSARLSKGLDGTPLRRHGVKTTWTCTRIEGHLYASDSLPCLFGAVHGHLPRIHNREQGSRLAEARDSLLTASQDNGRANRGRQDLSDMHTD